MQRYTMAIVVMIAMLAVLLAACARTTAAPESGVVVECPEPAEGNQQLMNEEAGYCLVYPQGYVAEGPFFATMINLAPGRQGQEPRLPFAEIQVTQAEGRSAAQVADEMLAGMPGFPIERSTLTLDGEEAILLDRLPGQELNRQLLVVKDGLLYRLTFVPADQAAGELYNNMEMLYNTVIGSFNFLSAGAQAPSETIPGPEMGPPSESTPEPQVEQPATPTSTPSEEVTPAPPPVAATTLNVAFIKEETLWMWSEESGEAQPLTGGMGITDLQMADDGQIIAFRRGDSLWVINSDGTNERELVTPAMLSSGQGATIDMFGWVPGTHTLAFNTRRSSDGPGYFPNHDLYQVDVATSEVTILLPPGEGGHFHYSLDGSQLAVVTPGRIDLVNADGSNHRAGALAFTPPVTYGEAAYYARPQWTRDGSALVVAVPPPDPFASSGEATTVWRIPADGSESTPVGTLNVAPFSQPAFASDLNHAVYLHPNSAGTPTNELHLVQLGSEPSVYHPEATAIVEWSPDGMHFIFEASNDGTSNRLMLGRIGAEAVPLFDTEQMAIDLRWVDENRFLYLSGGSNGWQLRLATLDGSSTLLADIAGSPAPYDFSAEADTSN